MHTLTATAPSPFHLAEEPLVGAPPDGNGDEMVDGSNGHGNANRIAGGGSGGGGGGDDGGNEAWAGKARASLRALAGLPPEAWLWCLWWVSGFAAYNIVVNYYQNQARPGLGRWRGGCGGSWGAVNLLLFFLPETI